MQCARCDRPQPLEIDCAAKRRECLIVEIDAITEQSKAKTPNKNNPNYRKIFSQITEFKQKVLYLQRISIKKDVTMYKKRILDKLLERKLKGCGAGA